MSDYTNTPIGSGYNTNSAINTELSAVETAVNSKLDKSGSTMTGELDMNSKKIINLPDATTLQEPVTYGQMINGASFAAADAKYFDTVALATADTTLKVGDVVIIEERANGIFNVISGTGTANTWNIVAHTSLSLSLKLVIDNPSTAQFGMVEGGTSATNAGAFNQAVETLALTGDTLSLSAGSFSVDKLTFSRLVPVKGNADSVTFTTAVTSGQAIEVGDSTYRQTASTDIGWTCEGFRLTGNANADYGIVICNSQGDKFSNIIVHGFSKTGADGWHITGNPNTIGETNPYPTIIGSFYNEFNNCYAYGCYNNVTFTGVADEGQANANVWYGGPSRQATNYNINFDICNDNKVIYCSLEASASTSHGAYFGAVSNGNIVEGCRFEGTYTTKPWEINAAAVNSVLVNNYYGAYYANNDPLNASYDADGGTGTKIDEYRLSVGNVSTLVVNDILADEITAKAASTNLDIKPVTGRDVVFKEDDGTTICQFGNLSGQGGFRFTPLGLFYVPNGTTANRPTPTTTGAHYWDSTLSKPIWWNGSGWEDATGASV